MAGTFEQFVAFGTDIVGLERLMRLLQALFTILTVHPTLLPVLLPGQPKAVHQASVLAMLELSNHLKLARRAIRLFWCLGSFQSSLSGLASPPSPGKSRLEAWLSITADSLFGLFGLVESLTLPDLLPGRHVSVLGRAAAVKLDGQAQGLWLAALLCAVLRSCVRLLGAFADRAVPPTGGVFAVSDRGEGDVKTTGTAKSDDDDDDDAAAAAAAAERQRRKREKEREVLDKQHGRKIGALTRKLAAEVLDLAIPASRMGLVDMEVGTVAVAMLFSTLLTGYAVWERCGIAIDAKRA
ncbi:hypothetical protein E4U41_002591 [Claviceps citrina]|nr:hypothetical protein E4U41_002591 [Claviceps citrina]